MGDKINASGSIVGFLERLVALESKYGFFNIIKGLALIVLTVCVAMFAINPNSFFKRVQDYLDSQHDAAMERRMQVDPLIRGELLELAYKTNADRAWVIEFHNGTTSLGGLPFRFGDMTYEQPPQEVSMMDTNQNISLSRFIFVTNLYEQGYWYGDLEEIAEIDKSFYYKMRSEGVQYIAIMTIQGTDAPIGFLAVTYSDSLNVEQHVLGRHIRNTAAKLSNWLESK